MSSTQVVLLVLLVVSASVCIWKLPRWVRIALASTLLGIQLVVLAVGFDARARHVLAAEIASGRASADAAHAVALVRNAQFPDRVSVLLASIGLYILLVLDQGTGTTRSKLRMLLQRAANQKSAPKNSSG